MARVCIRETVHEEAEIAVFPWVEHKVPMVWHEDIGKNAHVGELLCFLEEFFKEEIVLLFIEYLHATIRTIDHVIDFSANVDPCETRHGESIHETTLSVN